MIAATVYKVEQTAPDKWQNVPKGTLTFDTDTTFDFVLSWAARKIGEPVHMEDIVFTFVDTAQPEQNDD